MQAFALEWFLVDGKALDQRFYIQMRVKNKAFAYRGTMGGL